MIFERVLAGVDGSDESLRAARLAQRLRAPTGHMLVVTIAETHYAMYAGLEAGQWERRVLQRAEEIGAQVRREFDEDLHVETTVRSGRAERDLLSVAADRGSDLIALGASGQGRAAGIILGSVATRVIHDAACSVLVARGDERPELFPCKIVAGVDGSEPAAHARAVAEALAAGFRAKIDVITAESSPVDRLLGAASSGCDLLVVGSRGLHGIKSLGSVAERVAHEAPCPVLIVRGTYGAIPGRAA